MSEALNKSGSPVPADVNENDAADALSRFVDYAPARRDGAGVGETDAPESVADDGQPGAEDGPLRVILKAKRPDGEAPDASDPRWPLFAEWARKSFAYSQGLGAYTDFDNLETTYGGVANAFHTTRFVRPAWIDKKGKPRGKDGPAVSGAVLKYSKPVADMTEAERKELNIGPPDEPGKFQKNFRDSNVDRVEGLMCFDLDGKPGEQPMPRVRGKLRDERLSASGYTTHNHKVEYEKWRVVLYLKHSIPTASPEQRAVYSRAYHLIGQTLFSAEKDAYDDSCANPARVIYLPSHDGKSPVASWFEPGMQLDPTPYLERARAEIAAEAAGASKRRTSNNGASAKDGTSAKDAPYWALLQQVRPVIAEYKGRLNLPGFFGEPLREEVHIPCCPWEHEHTDGKTTPGDSLTSVGAGTQALPDASSRDIDLVHGGARIRF